MTYLLSHPQQLPDFKISGLVRVYKVTEKTGNVSFVDSSVDSHLTLLRGDLPSGEYTEFRTDELSPIISYRKFHQKVLEFLFREMYVLSLVSVVLGSSICGLFLYSIHRSLRNHSDNFCGDMNLLISIKDFILLQVLWTPFIIWGFSVSTGNQLCIFSFAVTYCIENVCESFWRGRIFLSLDTLSCSLIIAGNIFPLILTRYIIWRALVHKPIRDISINRGDTSESSGYIVTTVIWITGACLILVSVIIHCISFKAFLMKSGWTAIAFCPLGYQAHMYFWFTISRYALSCRHSREKQKSD